MALVINGEKKKVESDVSELQLKKNFRIKRTTQGVMKPPMSNTLIRQRDVNDRIIKQKENRIFNEGQF